MGCARLQPKVSYAICTVISTNSFQKGTAPIEGFGDAWLFPRDPLGINSFHIWALTCVRGGYKSWTWEQVDLLKGRVQIDELDGSIVVSYIHILPHLSFSHELFSKDGKALKIIYTMRKERNRPFFFVTHRSFWKASVSSCRRSSHGVLRRDAKGGPPVRQHHGQEQTETHQWHMQKNFCCILFRCNYWDWFINLLCACYFFAELSPWTTRRLSWYSLRLLS